jgi:tRNA-intron endonuclease
MIGKLFDGSVIIKDSSDAKKLQDKGFGRSLPDKSLKLSLLEAAFLIEKDRIKVSKDKERVTLPDIYLMAIPLYPQFEIQYLVYRDLKKRGYIVKEESNSFDFSIYDKGERPPDHPKYKALALSERSTICGKELKLKTEEIDKGKKLLLGIIDEESDITYYEAGIVKLKGRVNSYKYPEGKADLTEERAIIWDEELASLLYDKEWFGKPVGDGLQLSLIETAYLIEKGMIEIFKQSKPLSFTAFRQYAKTIQPNLEDLFKVYKDLKVNKLVVKTGFKFGSHFRVYKSNLKSEHAPYLIHMVKQKELLTWQDISRAVRLAHSVRKQMIFALVNKGITYLQIQRISP